MLLGIDVQPGYSDYEPFRQRKVPYMFLTSGACQDYHQTSDVADRIDARSLRARAVWTRDLTAALLDLETRPTWRDERDPRVDEIENLRTIIGNVKAALPKLKGIPPVAKLMVENFSTFLDKVLEDGQVTPEERKTARNSAVMLFRAATAIRPPQGG